MVCTPKIAILLSREYDNQPLPLDLGVTYFQTNPFGVVWKNRPNPLANHHFRKEKYRIWGLYMVIQCYTPLANRKPFWWLISHDSWFSIENPQSPVPGIRCHRGGEGCSAGCSGVSCGCWGIAIWHEAGGAVAPMLDFTMKNAIEPSKIAETHQRIVIQKIWLVDTIINRLLEDGLLR